jgi:hypothetical protein
MKWLHLQIALLRLHRILMEIITVPSPKLHFHSLRSYVLYQEKNKEIAVSRTQFPIFNAFELVFFFIIVVILTSSVPMISKIPNPANGHG